MPCLNTLLAADVLTEGLSRLADIEHIPLDGAAARLDAHPGARPVLYLDVDAAPQDVCRAMTETLLALTFGPGAATTATPVRRLRSVG